MIAWGKAAVKGFGEEFYFKDPFLNLGMFMISMLISISVLYDLTCNLTLFKLKEDTFEIRTIFKKDEINATETKINIETAKQVLLVQIISDDNKIYTKKVIN